MDMFLVAPCSVSSLFVALAPLAHPPLIEAICELRFAQPIVVDPALSQDLRGLGFPDPPRRWTGAEVIIDTTVSPPTPTVRHIERDQYIRPDGSMMVQVGDNVLVVNHLRPYATWPSYLSVITRVLAAFSARAGGGTLERAGLRYLNRLTLVPPHIRVRDVLRIFALTGEPFDGRPLRGFYQRYDLMYPDEGGGLTLQVGVGTDQNGPHVVLDIDFGSSFGSTPPFAPFDAPAWLEAAHGRVESVFVGSLNPSYLAQLQAGGHP
jgi:uncharacterized protein (TIGR04255 family)